MSQSSRKCNAKTHTHTQAHSHSCLAHSPTHLKLLPVQTVMAEEQSERNCWSQNRSLFNSGNEAGGRGTHTCRVRLRDGSMAVAAQSTHTHTHICAVWSNKAAAAAAALGLFGYYNIQSILLGNDGKNFNIFFVITVYLLWLSWQLGIHIFFFLFAVEWNSANKCHKTDQQNFNCSAAKEIYV